MNSTLTEVIRDAATVHPGRTALVYEDRRYSYGDAWARVCAVAAGMRRHGVEYGDRVAICLGNCPETIFAFWAAQKVGACPVVVAPDRRADQLAFILDSSGARLCLASASVTDELRRRERDRTPLPESVVRPDSSGAIVEPKALRVSPDDVQAEIAAPLIAISVDLAAIVYTTGSTGMPKGVMLSHQNMVAATRSLVSYLCYRADDVVMAPLPLSFDYSLYQMILTFHAGGTLVLEPDAAVPACILRDIQGHRCTVVPGIASLYTLLGAYASLASFDLGSVRMVTNTGMALRGAHIAVLRRLFPRAEIFSMYGLTECKRCTFLPPADLSRKPESVGIAIPDTQITVVGEDGQPCATGEIGQIVVRSATVMVGYWKDPEGTSAHIGRHPVHGDRCLFTGDYGWLDGEGYVYLLGRSDGIAKVRGHKVVLSDVEAALHRDPSVREAVAMVCSAVAEGEELLVAFVAGRGPVQPSERQLRRACAVALEPYQVPQAFVIVDRLPRHSNGKFERGKLAQLYRARAVEPR